MGKANVLFHPFPVYQAHKDDGLMMSCKTSHFVKSTILTTWKNRLCFVQNVSHVQAFCELQMRTLQNKSVSGFIWVLPWNSFNQSSRLEPGAFCLINATCDSDLPLCSHLKAAHRTTLITDDFIEMFLGKLSLSTFTFTVRYFCQAYCRSLQFQQMDNECSHLTLDCIM